MPAQTWEEILQEARLSADEQKLLDNLVKRVPEFKDGRLRQSEFSRLTNDMQRKKKEYDDAIALKDQVNGWWEEKKPIFEALVEAGAIDDDAKPVWPEEKKRLQRELDEAKKAALAGGDMDPAELDRRVREIVKANGGVTQDELKALVASEAGRLARESFQSEYEKVKAEFNQKTIPFAAGIAAANALAAFDYEKTTGEEFTPEKQSELFNLMTKENNMDPRAVMKIFLKPVVEKKNAEAEIERRVQERLDKERQRMGYDPDQPFIPQEVTGEQQMGSLKRMLAASAEAEGDIEGLVAAASRKAAAELRAGK